MMSQSVEIMRELAERQHLLQAISAGMEEPRYPFLDNDQNAFYKDIQKRWLRWQSRLVLYIPTHEESYLHLKKWWLRVGRVNHRLEVIREAFNALAELNENPKIDNHTELANLILRTIDLELQKLEFKQIRKLSQDQHAFRTELHQLASEIAFNKKNLSEQFRVKKYSQQLNASELSYLRQFFLLQEKWRFRIKSVVSKSIPFTDTGNVVSSTGHVVITVQQVLPGLIEAGKAGTVALSAIPAVGALSTAVPLLFDAARNWLKNKSTSTQIASIALAGVVLGAIVVSGIFPVAAAGISCALITFGIFKQYVTPWSQTRKQIIEREREIETLNDLITRGSITKLSANQRHALLVKVEEHMLAQIKDGKKFDPKSLQVLRDVIQKGSLKEIRENNTFTSILKAANYTSVNNFLIQHAWERRSKLAQEVTELEKLKQGQFARMINGILSLVGAVLVCIPTPPTLIAGAAILGGTSLVGLGLKYQWFEKAKGFISNLFGKKEPSAVKDTSKLEQTLENKNVLRRTSTTIIKDVIPQNSVPPAMPQTSMVSAKLDVAADSLLQQDTHKKREAKILDDEDDDVERPGKKF